MNDSGIRPERLEQMMESRQLLPEAILDEFMREPLFAVALNGPGGVGHSFTLRTHTQRVMECYEKHFASRAASQRERALFRLFLALHDIGKPRAMEAGDKRWQHRFTVGLMRQTRGSYPVTDREFEDWIALVDGDPLGEYLKGETGLAEGIEGIRRGASRSSLPAREFFGQMLMYYQCDVSAYTRRAGLINALDGLFEWQDGTDEIAFDEEAGFLKFSDTIRRKMENVTVERIWGKSL